jgi:hypothetical protein
MSDGTMVAGWLLVGGPVLGLIPVAHPALVRIWSMPRESFVAAVATHRVAWAWLNAGFALATILTTGGLAALAVTVSSRPASAAIVTCAIAYGIGGVLWSAVLAIRTRTTPLLGDLGGNVLASREVAILDAGTSGLFQAFALITSAALAALGLTLLLSGVVVVLIGVVVLLAGAAGVAWLLVTGDVIPAALYVPTLLVGVDLLVGW